MKILIFLLTFSFANPEIIFSQAGILDTTFGGDGKVLCETLLNSTGNALAIQSDGKILIAGHSLQGTSTKYSIVRLNTNGTIDESFGDSGTWHEENGSDAKGIAIQNDGKIVCTGTRDQDFMITRNNIDGSPDMSFGTDGMVYIDFEGLPDSPEANAIDADGNIYAAGTALVDSKYNFAVVKYDSIGIIDLSFGDAGKVLISIGTGNEGVHDIAIQPDGKILLAGATASSGTDFAVVRLNSDGSPDNTFEGDGIVVTNFSEYQSYASAIKLQTDKKIILAGRCATLGSNGWDFAMARYLENGNLDESFGVDGKVVTPLGTEEDIASDILIQPDGKIILTGWIDHSDANDNYCLVRYFADGTIDSSFGIDENGIVETEFGPGDDYCTAAEFQPDGKIVVAGYSFGLTDFNIAVARYLSDFTFTSIEPYQDVKSKQIFSYPNPTSNFITILTPDNYLYFVIRNLNGEPIISAKVKHNQFQIDVHDLSPGIYSIELIKENHEIITGSFVKN
jgi:uncharacterized delta-60 repeat protein